MYETSLTNSHYVLFAFKIAFMSLSISHISVYHSKQFLFIFMYYYYKMELETFNISKTLSILDKSQLTLMYRFQKYINQLGK